MLVLSFVSKDNQPPYFLSIAPDRGDGSGAEDDESDTIEFEYGDHSSEF